MTPSADEVVRALGGRRGRCRCPVCAREGRDKSGDHLAVRQDGDRTLVHCHAGCPQRDVIRELRSWGLWPERRALNAAERKEWARLHQAEIEAAFFAQAARELAEECLESASDTDPSREALTGVLRGLRESPLAEHRSWIATHPRWAKLLVAAGRRNDERMRRAALRLMESLEVPDAT